MRRKDPLFDIVSELGPRRAGGGGLSARGKGPSQEIKDTLRSGPTRDWRGVVEQSIRDRGGYPTRDGKPLMTKMEQRAAKRRAESGGTTEFARGGAVKGKRDYAK
jgi:hypothetical protein